MHVYMDAVLYPNIYITEEIFKQEGWHYELESEEEIKDAITKKWTIETRAKSAEEAPGGEITEEEMPGTPADQGQHYTRAHDAEEPRHQNMQRHTA